MTHYMFYNIVLYQYYNLLSKINLVGNYFYLYLWGWMGGEVVNTGTTNNKYMMTILGWIIVGLVGVSITMGMVYADEFQMAIEIIHPSSGMYMIGLSSRNHVWDNGDRENHVEIGFYLVVLSISFFVYSENIPAEQSKPMDKILKDII